MDTLHIPGNMCVYVSSGLFISFLQTFLLQDYPFRLDIGVQPEDSIWFLFFRDNI